MQKFINSSQPTVWVAYLREGGRRGTAKMRGIGILKGPNTTLPAKIPFI